MNRLLLLTLSLLLAGVASLTVLACNISPVGQPQPTPVPPATPLPPNTPVPAPTAVPRAIQRGVLGPSTAVYMTANSLQGANDNLGKLVVNSTVIVIGTVPSNDPVAVRVQDQSAANVHVVGSGFNVQVERYLKGSGGDTIPVVQFYGLDYTDQGETWQTRDTNEGLLLGKNNRYLLFLRENRSQPGYWSGPALPYKFLLAGGQATAESPVGDLRGAFPEQSEPDFISSVEEKIASSP